jgi:hypothetical protein
LINDRSIEANPYLKLRGESQLRAKHAFEHSAGWRFGFLFGVLLVFAAYGWDAMQLFLIHAEFWWTKLALACITILPLAIMAGGIGGFVNWLGKVFLWGFFGVLAGYCAIHIPFEGARLVLRNIDETLHLVEFLPIPAAATDSFARLAALGVCLGILVGLAQSMLVGWAWERANEDYKLTAGGWALFLLTFPLVLALAFLFDATTNAPLRAPMQLLNSAAQSGLNDLPDLDSGEMELERAFTYHLGQEWRNNFVPEYTVHLAASEPSRVGESFVDLAFANGYLWRCRVTTSDEITGSCYDLKHEYARYISEFVPRGSFRCTECEARVSEQAQAWRAANARSLGEGDRVAITHGAGSSVLVRVESAQDNDFECLLSGANPVTIEHCGSTN